MSRHPQRSSFSSRRAPSLVRLLLVAGLVVALLTPSAAAAAKRKKGKPAAPATPAAPAGESSPIQALFQQVNPAVVEIATTGREVVPVAGDTRETRYVTVEGLGSGAIVSAEGLVLTAAHVIQTADTLSIRLADGREFSAHPVGSEPQADVALVQIEGAPGDLPVVEMGDSERVRVGEKVFVIGAPFGIGHTLTVGHVSARRRPGQLSANQPVELFQTDAAINQGNSGGPMFNLKGELIGVVSFILSRTGGFQGLGFAVTSNTARSLLFEGRTLWTGMDGYVLDGELAKLFNVPQPRAMLVQRVVANSPADRLGIRAGTRRMEIGGEELLVGGDILLSAFGISIADEDGLNRIRSRRRNLKDDDQVNVRVLRAGAVVELSASLSALTE